MTNDEVAISRFDEATISRLNDGLVRLDTLYETYHTVPLWELADLADRDPRTSPIMDFIGGFILDVQRNMQKELEKVIGEKNYLAAEVRKLTKKVRKLTKKRTGSRRKK